MEGRALGTEQKVCKFGGTSLADASQFRRVKAIVECDPTRRYVVPSAPGKRHAGDEKITDLLYRCHDRARQGLSFDDIFDAVADRYLQIVRDLEIAFDLRPQIEEIRATIPKESAAYAASRGEALNGMLLAAYLGVDYVDAAEVIRFDADGRYDEEATQRALAPRLAQHERAVVPGFYGTGPDGRIRTFSRGGSDITGAIVARAANATVYENWTDVSGLLMADPRIVEQPRSIGRLSYAELRELSYMGATVFHTEAVFPIRSAGIPIHIRNVNDPDAPGTWILPEVAVDDGPPITGIAGRRDFVAITLARALMNEEVGFGRRLLSVIEANEISFDHLASGIDSISVVIDSQEIGDRLPKLLDDIRAACAPDTLTVHSEMALIATVGRAIAHRPGIGAKLFDALSAEQINVRMTAQSSGGLNIIVGVDNAVFERAVRAIYRAFVV